MWRRIVEFIRPPRKSLAPMVLRILETRELLLVAGLENWNWGQIERYVMRITSTIPFLPRTKIISIRWDACVEDALKTNL